MKKDVIILTKSIKRGGYCVAGIDVNSGKWVRIVSDNVRNEHAILDSDMIYSDGTVADILDIVRIDFLRSAATPIQPENLLLNDSVQWIKLGKTNLSDVVSIHPYENPDFIFYNCDKSVALSDIKPTNHSSLFLIEVPQSYIYIKTFERKRFNLNFTYNQREYQYISITDERIRNMYADKPDGSYPCRNNIPVVFSLADMYEGRYYKIAAQLL